MFPNSSATRSIPRRTLAGSAPPSSIVIIANMSSCDANSASYAESDTT
ncbi:MAG: hypothetical protein U0V56_04375 [Actinomycetota bacterium]